MNHTQLTYGRSRIEIKITNTNLDSNTIILLLNNKLNHNPTSTTLRLHGNNIKNDCMIKIVELLKNHTNIKKVYMFNNKIKDEEAKLIAHMLKTTDHLTLLDLSYNYIGDNGAKYISKALKQNTSLTNIELYKCKIGNQGIKHIFDAIKDNTTIKRLDLSTHIRASHFSNDTIKSICDFLRINKTLTVLYIDSIKMECDSIISAFEYNPSIIIFCQKNTRIIEICKRNKHNLEQKALQLVDL
jgi:Ran GTPase-activating protein (RanGAP) involved in mRNA processing and transport